MGGCTLNSVQQLAILRYKGAANTPQLQAPSYNQGLPQGLVSVILKNSYILLHLRLSILFTKFFSGAERVERNLRRTIGRYKFVLAI